MASDVIRVHAGELYQLETSGGNLLRSVDNAEDDWRLVTAAPKTTLQPNNTDVGGRFMPEITTVTYADWSQRRSTRTTGWRSDSHD
ncbi:hypothetical protein MTOK_42440 [Mycolicibacterium tokaiense]|nr:hypothetical protein MTOK_42440 [Mycolicibacterium tokaiense]